MIYFVIWGLKLTRETPPGECGRKVKLKGIDGDLYKGWRCGLIRIPRKTLPIFVLVMINGSYIKFSLFTMLDKLRYVSCENVGVSLLFFCKISYFHLSVPMTRVHGCRQLCCEVLG